MNVKLFTVISVLVAVYIFSVPAFAVEPSVVVEAGLLEWGEGYVTATEGFELSFEGKIVQGTSLYYDTNSGDYLLDEIGFTACAKLNPHYRVLAKRLEIFQGERLVFTQAVVQIGQVKIPIPFKLVLEYREGEYHFPDWLPELFYGQDGLGVRLNAALTPTNALSLKGSVSLTTTGDVNFDASSIYKMGYGVSVDGLVAYDELWSNRITLNWRASKTGWNTAFTIKQKQGSEIQPLLEVVSPKYEIAGINQTFRGGVTTITESMTKVRHDKVYIRSIWQDEYRLGQTRINWSLQPAYTWLTGYGFSGNNTLNLGITQKIGDSFKIDAGYSRGDLWGAVLPAELAELQPTEYVRVGAAYSQRNDLDEGWDLELSGRYNLTSQKLEFAQTKIVKAFDCFDIQVDLELVKPAVKVGMKLKY